MNQRADLENQLKELDEENIQIRLRLQKVNQLRNAIHATLHNMDALLKGNLDEAINVEVGGHRVNPNSYPAKILKIFQERNCPLNASQVTTLLCLDQPGLTYTSKLPSVKAEMSRMVTRELLFKDSHNTYSIHPNCSKRIMDDANKTDLGKKNPTRTGGKGRTKGDRLLKHKRPNPTLDTRSRNLDETERPQLS